ncbi:MAG: VanZ family protein [Hydrogenophilaceae bacterium]|nr:VanZ family protein [Hydrogenophilaceae bacterium]
MLRRHGLLLFLLAYAALILYGSLHPFGPWRPPADWSPAFLVAALPRFITRTDLTTNLLAYAPLGYALALEFSRTRSRRHSLLLASLLCLGYSFLLENLQTLLPNRNASNLDIAINSLGGWCGALLARQHRRWLAWLDVLYRWRERWFLPGAASNTGLVLLALWPLAQFSLMPFPAMGWVELYLRPIEAGLATKLNWPWLLAIFLEMAVLGSFAAALLRPGRYAGPLALLFVSAFAMKVVIAVLLLRFGVLGGVLSLETLGGFVATYWFLLLPPAARQRLVTAAALLGSVVLLRLTLAKYLLLPASNPFNIVGLADLTASLWPYLALATLFALAWRRDQA